MKAKLNNNRIHTVLLPYPGDYLEVEGMGKALVEGISHCQRDNYISLQFQDSKIGMFRQTFAFSVERF